MGMVINPFFFNTPVSGVVGPYVGGKSVEAAFNTTSDFTTSLTNLTGGTDSAPIAGDIVIIAYGEQGGDLDMQVSTSGYTEVCDLRAVNAAANNFGVFYKVMGGTPDTSVSLVRANLSTSSRVIIQVWRGVNAVTPMDVAAVTATGTDSAQPNPPSITPVTSGALVVAAGTATYTIIAPFTSSDLSGMLSDFSDSISDVATGMASVAWAGGAVNPAKWGGGNANASGCWCACTMALRPA